MKSAKRSMFVMVFLITIASISFAQSENSYYPADKYEISEANYLEGLSSGNHGLEVSCAYFLGEMKSQKAVIPLMKMFREAKKDREKLVAGWSLLKIGDPRGTFLVKRAIELGESKQISPILFYLYEHYELKRSDSEIAVN
jgi:hypothetical protein